MRFYKYFLLFFGGLFLFGEVVHAATEEAFIVEEKGRNTWHMMLDKKMDTSSKQWVYARKTQNKGWLKKADRRMLYLVRRWPNSKEAPWAQRARGDMLYARGKFKEAFREYQHLINNYSSRMLDYSSVLESQFAIAVNVMEQRRMRWFFGGYRAPEYSVEYFEDVIRNGPQGVRAAEAQFFIGQAYREANELEMAISAYGVLGYRYSESSFAEKAAWLQIICLDKLREEFPNSLDILDRQLTSTTVFLTTYPQSTHKGKIIQLRNRLYEMKAKKVFDEAMFYAKIPKKPKAAIIYYERMLKEYPKSKLVPEAEKQIVELKDLMAISRATRISVQQKTEVMTNKKGSENVEK